MTVRRRVGLLIGVVAAVVIVLPGCTSTPAKEAVPAAASPAAAPPELAITPAADAADVPVSVEIGTTVTNGRISSVVLTDDKGATVTGSMREDGTSWVPDAPLKHNQRYTAQVTATNDAGATTTQGTTFTTMAKPARQESPTLHFADKAVYGVAMPVTVRFEKPVPKEDRAGVQRRLFVRTDPPQPGVWHWVEDGSQVFYRAPDYWKPGTTVSVRAALGGHPLGGGRYGAADETATAKIDRKVVLEVDNRSKKIEVYRDDKHVKSIPVSLGKPRTPSSSGTMVIMEKAEQTIFDTFAELGPVEGYRVAVDYAQRLTWGGEFIHSAPWSVGDQGRRNVSHGCLNVSPANARWLFDLTKVGDPVTVRNTEVKLAPGNGWTAWDMTWEQFVKGSALPVPADLKPAPASPSAASPSASGQQANGAPSPAQSSPGR